MRTQTIYLQAGESVTVTADASSSGHVAIIPPASFTPAFYTVAASSSVVIGPYNESRPYIITSDLGLLTYVKSKTGLLDRGGNANVTFSGSPIVLDAGTVGTADGISVVEYGAAGFHQTVITLDNVSVPIVSVTTGRGVGGTLLYTFPAGFIASHGAIGTLSISVAEAEQSNIVTAANGDIGVGSVAPANADALGTDATDDDYGTATATLLSSWAQAGIRISPEALLVKDGHSTAAEVYLNAAVDAADVADDASSAILVSGTLTLNWINLGDN